MRLIRPLLQPLWERPLVWLAASLSGAALVTACGSQSSAPGGNAGIQESAAQVSASSSDKVLRLLYWQAPTTLNPHLSTGSKDKEASHIVLEPLAAYNEAGELEPILAADVPTIENGGLSADYSSVTWTLKEGVIWSDGQPFTAEDAIFTYEFASNPDSGATTAESYSQIESMEALDNLTVRITFSQPTPSWADPFVGTDGMILPKHLFQNYVGAQARSAPGNTQPVGTGPYQAVEFRPGDTIIYERNPNFRGEAPFFERVELKGGGDAVSAARAVLQTGDADFAWNILAEPSVIQDLLAGGQGQMTYLFRPAMERIHINFSDPNREVDGQRSNANAPHPFLTEKPVRQAISLAIDRDTIVEQLYGEAGQVATNLIVAPDRYVSPNTTYEFNLEKASALLDQAGWVDSNNNGIRDQNGVEMRLLFTTSVNPVRQKTQEIIKQSLESIGMQVELKTVDAGTYFFGDPTNPDSNDTFYADLQMFTSSSGTPEPDSTMALFACDEIAQKENQWSKGNLSRYCNPEYDALLEQLEQELDPERRQALFIQMNDLLIEDVALIPLVRRSTALALSNSLMDTAFTPWNSATWKVNAWGHR